MFLSGGIDLSAIVALASPFRRARVDTFSIAFEGRPIAKHHARSSRGTTGLCTRHEPPSVSKGIDGWA